MYTLKQFLQELNVLSFWGRVFGWSRIKRSLVDALTELQLLTDIRDQYHRELEMTRRELEQSKMLLDASEKRMNDLQRDKSVQDSQLNGLREKVRTMDIEVADLKNKEEVRNQESQRSQQALYDFREEVREERRREREEKQALELQNLERQRETWQRIGKRRIKVEPGQVKYQHKL